MKMCLDFWKKNSMSSGFMRSVDVVFLCSVSGGRFHSENIPKCFRKWQDSKNVLNLINNNTVTASLLFLSMIIYFS